MGYWINLFCLFRDSFLKWQFMNIPLIGGCKLFILLFFDPIHNRERNHKENWKSQPQIRVPV